MSRPAILPRPRATAPADPASTREQLLRAVAAAYRDPQSSLRSPRETIESLRGMHDLMLWVSAWMDPERASSMEQWRRADFDPAWTQIALGDLLVYATLARDWYAVATCAIALDAVNRRGGELPVDWREHLRGLVVVPGHPPVTIPEINEIRRGDPSVRLTPEESDAVCTCVLAWNLRARRLRGDSHASGPG